MLRHLPIILSFFLLVIACDGNGDPNGDQLLKAAANGDIIGMEKVLQTGININYTNPNFLSTEQTACAKAALNGQLKALKWLIAKGADWQKGTSGNETPMSFAAKKNHFDIVFYLIELGADINYQETNYGMTALMHAADYGNTSAGKRLIELGADYKLMNKQKETAMTIAIKRRQPKILSYFLSQNIPFHHPFHTVARYQNDTHLHNNDKRTIDILIAKGADINEMSGGYTPIHHASMWANDELMDYFISKGANRSIRTANGMTTQDLYGYNKQDHH